jgi:uncharacterized RmlC-like cupin family protein
MSDRPDRVRVIPPGERTAGPATPGMDRQQAFLTDAVWAGFVRTEPETASGWHHHGEHETIVYVLTGSLRFEFGPGGADETVATPGDFALVPRGLVHRESTPASQPCEVIVVRAGRGESSVNVEGPVPA